nr:hypothetical protein [Tanacetum cinerariifolium]
ALPVQAIHMDITEYNVVWARDDHAMWQLQGLIDFGDLTYSPLLPSLNGQAFVTVDLGVLSEHFEAGNWEQSGIDEQLLKETAHAQGLAASRYGEYRLSRTQPDSAREPETCALHVEVVIPHGTAVHAPFHGTLRHTADGALML